MRYTQTITQTLNSVPLGKNVPNFKAMSFGAGKTAPFFITISNPLKGKSNVKYHLDHDPKEDIVDDYRIDEGPVEINDPEPQTNTDDDYSHTHYDTTSTTKHQKIIYHCQHNVDDIDDRGVIEIPATNDTVIYQDEEGQYYEVPVSDLIEYDGDDGEITYHSKAKGNRLPLTRKHHIKDIPNYYLNMIMAKHMMAQQRVYGA